MDEQEDDVRAVPRRGRRWSVIAGAALAVGGVVAGVAAASAERSEPDPAVEQDARLVDLEAVDIPAELRVPVEDSRNPGAEVPIGWADRRLVLPKGEDHELARQWCAKPAPVVDERGEVVGFMFDGYGFVDREEALADGFSIRERQEQGSQEAGSRTCPSDR